MKIIIKTMRNKKTGQFKKFSLGFKIKLSFAKWYERKKYIIAALVWGLLVGTLLGFALFSPKISTPEAVEPIISNEVVEVAKPYCIDVVGCIRDVGESLGFSNKDILIAINISRAESGFRADAIGVNKNGSIDRGCMQINSIHKRLSNKDAFDYEKNIRFAYQLRIEQGNWNAWSTCHNGKVNCN